MKFKVGDKVKIKKWDNPLKIFGIGDNDPVNVWARTANIMYEDDGAVFAVTKRNPLLRRYTVKKYDGEETWTVSEKLLEPVENKIVITTDGEETTAKLCGGDVVVRMEQVSVSPAEEFDFRYQARRAFDKLTCEKAEYVYGAKYKIANNLFTNHNIELGKIVTAPSNHVICGNLAPFELGGCIFYLSLYEVEQIRDCCGAKMDGDEE